jgi:hypothetical protein
MRAVIESTLSWLEALGWAVKHGPESARTHPSPRVQATPRWCWLNACAMCCYRN